jgi:hypothetical protein
MRKLITLLSIAIVTVLAAFVFIIVWILFDRLYK